jgi:hypothetical protein
VCGRERQASLQVTDARRQAREPKARGRTSREPCRVPALPPRLR